MSDMATRLTERLTRAERDQSFPNVRPKDAASLILIDRSSRPPKVLLGRRHQNHKFMPGKFVFPGGSIEPSDCRALAASPLDPRDETRLLTHARHISPARARGLALAAIRETFEETGLLLGAQRRDVAAVGTGPWAAFAQAGILPDLASMHFVARAITPPRRPKRFDTRFFATDAANIAARVDGVVGPDSELVELIWVPIPEAVRLDMPSITTVILEELACRLESGMSRDLPVPFYRMLNGKFVRALL